MTTPITLDRILALNDELSALAAAGVPVDLGQTAPTKSVDEVLDKAGANIALRQGRGQTLEEAVTDNPDLPLGYRSALGASLKSSRLTMTLEALCHPAAARNEVRHVVCRALMGPLVVVTFAYFGLLFLCLHVTPTFADQYRQLGSQPSTSVRMLVTMRLWLPYWAPLVPLLLLGTALWWRHGMFDVRCRIADRKQTLNGHSTLVHKFNNHISNIIHPFKRYETAVRDAQLADSLARLLQQNVPLAEALRLASRMTGQPATVEAAERLALAIERGETVAPENPDLAGLPPVLRWVLATSQDSPTGAKAAQDEQAQAPGPPSLTKNLQFAAQTYRQQVRRRRNFWRVAAPAAGILLLAGPVTLAYALCLFEPLVQLWQDLAR